VDTLVGVTVCGRDKGRRQEWLQGRIELPKALE